MNDLKKFLPLALAAVVLYVVAIKPQIDQAIDPGPTQADAAVMAAMSSMVQGELPKPNPTPTPTPTPAPTPSNPPRPVPRVSLATYEHGEHGDLPLPIKQVSDETTTTTPEPPKKRYLPWEASVIVRSDKTGEKSRQGSGTAICFHTILTAAHLIGDGFDITVDGKPAVLVDIDRDADLALIRTDDAHQLKPAPVAKTGPRVGDFVMAWGYEWDKQGQLRGFPSKVTFLNRYKGPDNLIAAGNPPKSGRSGGGLFNASGELIGVCGANDPPDPAKRTTDGLYAGHNAILKMIDPTYKAPVIDVAKHVTSAEAIAIIAPPKQALAVAKSPSLGKPTLAAGASKNIPARGTSSDTFPSSKTKERR